MSANKSFSTETSERYSRALFEVTKEAGDLDKTETDIKIFKFVLENSLELKNFFSNPTQSINNQNNVNDLLSKKFRSRLLIRFSGKSLIQKKITKLLNTFKISSKIKFTVDVDPVNFG